MYLNTTQQLNTNTNATNVDSNQTALIVVH